MRIVTRPDFDGVVCAALLFEAEPITRPIKWVEPNDMQNGLVHIEKDDIIANLPYAENCALWFDHHVTNKPDTTFCGAFRIAPSAARVVFEYYQDRFKPGFRELVEELVLETDDIDSANLSSDQVLHPENYPYVLLSMTVGGRNAADEPYWNKLVHLFRGNTIQQIMADPEVIDRCGATVTQNSAFRDILLQHTRLDRHVAVTDFRSLSPAPEGNRFLAYSLFPDAIVSVKIRHEDNDRQKVIVSVGHSIFNRKCAVNVGRMLSQFSGGGHAGAGACSFHVDHSSEYIPQIIDLLQKNQKND